MENGQTQHGEKRPPSYKSGDGQGSPPEIGPAVMVHPPSYPQVHMPEGYLPPPGFKPNIQDPNSSGAQFINAAGDLGEDGEMKNFDFTDQSIRRSFIRKVYSILMCQLLVTMGFIALFIFHEPTKLWVRINFRTVYFSVLIPVFVVMILFGCFEKARRVFPLNFILLSIFTLGMSFVLGCLTSLFDSQIVMLAVGITAAICLALTLFALQTKWDFTAMGGILCVCLCVLFMIGIMAFYFPISRLLYSSLGAILFSFYLIYDTQVILGGKHKYAITPEEYIFAALALYLDFINLFMFILRILTFFTRG